VQKLTKNDESTKKVLYLVRGLPGSGKSTFARMISNHVCEADDYHLLSTGEYDWKPENVHASHVWCKNRCERFMQKNKPRIVVSNTSTTDKELNPYIDMALKYEYIVISVVVENRHEGVSIHEVPSDTITTMRNRLAKNIKL